MPADRRDEEQSFLISLCFSSSSNMLDKGQFILEENKACLACFYVIIKSQTWKNIDWIVFG